MLNREFKVMCMYFLSIFVKEKNEKHDFRELKLQNYLINFASANIFLDNNKMTQII